MALISSEKESLSYIQEYDDDFHEQSASCFYIKVTGSIQLTFTVDANLQKTCYYA